jgi:SAM-dependent methyltransferase
VRRVERVEVNWPSGLTQVIESPNLGPLDTLEITEPTVWELPCVECAGVATMHMASPAIAADALPNKGHGVRAINEREKRWDSDMPAYKRLRKEGHHPRSIDGAHDVERDAKHPLEIEMGRKLRYEDGRPASERDVERAQEIHSELSHNDPKKRGSEVGEILREQRKDAKKAKKVIAVDHSPRMVEVGRDLAKRSGLKNLEYRQGDMEQPPIRPGSVDVVILSQALHHAVHPPRALEAAWKILRPGGTVLILDLVEHSFEAAREMYADVWLGFAPAELSRLLREAGFEGNTVEVVAKEKEGPGFQTLLAVGMKPA